METTYVTLDEWDVRKVWMTADIRQETKREAGVVDERKSRSLSSQQIEFLGLAGEYAVAKILNLVVSLDTGARGDGGFGDLTFHDGRTIAVKTASRLDGNFNLKGTDPDRMYDDLCILCSFPLHANTNKISRLLTQPMKIRVVGYITRDEFLEYCEVKESRTGGFLQVSSEHFRPIDDLVQLSERYING